MTSVFILGLDGATWDLLDPLMAAGALPKLKALIEQGARAPLLSTFPPVTALAWPTFYTGQNAGKHGVFSFVRTDAQGQERVVDARAVRVPALWDILSAVGLKVGVVGVPITYPARPVNGFLISDFLTPPGATDACYPADLLADLETRHGPWRFHVPPLEGPITPETAHDFVSDLVSATADRHRAVLELLDRFDPDCFISVLMNTDTVQHTFWGYLHPEHPFYSRPDAAEVRARVLPIFHQIDDIIAELAARVLPDGLFLLMSDHGFGPMHRRLALNNALARGGFIRLRRSRLLLNRVQRRVRRTLGRPLPVASDEFRHVKRNQTQGQTIDWARTRAFAGAMHEMCIHFHRSDRYPGGAVSPDQIEPLSTAVAEALLQIRDEQGNPLIAAVQRPHELFHGPALADAPDLFVRPADVRDVLTDGILAGGRLYKWETNHAGGWHRPDGIFVAAGRGIGVGAGFNAAPTLLDIAPTVLHALGWRPADAMDGRVLSELFVDFTPPDRIVPDLADFAGADAGTDAGALSDEDEAALSARLRGLGYL